MNDEIAFLDVILRNPDDATSRLAYAAWLDERSDPRAAFVRMDPSLDAISYVAWLQEDGHLDYYLENSREVKQEAEERQATEQLRQRRRDLSSKLDPDWVAFFDTLACPFRPFLFFNNHGNPRELQPDELPFVERIGTRGRIITFESAFRDGKNCGQGLERDLRFLSELELSQCEYGASTCPVHPFARELTKGKRPLTGVDVLAALHARDFRSRYIEALDASTIPFPGYHPGDGSGTDNDEIHNDFAGQYVFRKTDEDSDEEVDEVSGTHGALKRFVVDGKLWYVVLHTTPKQEGESRFSRYVILFVVGKSPNGDRLVGVVTHQTCHNLCD
jgi:uncharacterized protein (TIGR02996 family)